MQRTDLIIYFWLFLTAAIVIIPCGYLLYVLWNKSSDFIERKAQVFKENKELKTIKNDLEEQKGIVSSYNIITKEVVIKTEEGGVLRVPLSLLKGTKEKVKA